MRPLALLVFVAACAQADAQQPEERDVFFGAGGCAAQACHGGGAAERQEYKIWATRDRHAKAFDSLAGDRGRRIGERLGIDPTKATECLACHGVTGVRTAATFDPHDGVSCELCHGAAGRWLGPHAAPGFKEKLAVDKEKLGFADLTTPAARAARCVTCHVGAEGKDLTHAMMAAGHPPLVFSLRRFLDAMPPHWKEETPHDLAAWEAGARVAAVARLRQVARMAEGAKEWPEFAAFDCYSCHQEIRGEGGWGAGHLPLDVAPLDVLAAGDPGLGQRLGRILGATYRPGGPRRPLAETALEMAGEIKDLPVTAATAAEFALGLDTALAKVEKGEARMGYATMQQVALAAYALAADPTAPAFAEAYRALDEALARPYDARACAALARRTLAAAR
jgi:hypothetical protein